MILKGNLKESFKFNEGTIGFDGKLFTILQAKFDQHLLKEIKKIKLTYSIGQLNLTTQSRTLKLHPEA